MQLYCINASIVEPQKMSECARSVNSTDMKPEVYAIIAYQAHY